MMATVGRMVSCLSMCARAKETPKLFLVRAFHLLVSRVGAGDVCIFHP